MGGGAVASVTPPPATRHAATGGGGKQAAVGCAGHPAAKGGTPSRAAAAVGGVPDGASHSGTTADPPAVRAAEARFGAIRAAARPFWGCKAHSSLYFRAA